ncbi:MAG: IPT/TIG domain-containing protein [Bacteroidota bacterium]
MKLKEIFFVSLFAILLATCSKAPEPELLSVTPEFGSAGTLVTFEGKNLANIQTMKFSDQVVNFNTAYNSENALLFRIPESLPLGDHVVTLETASGVLTTNFRVTLDPPEIFNFTPESADVGQEVIIYGENFFEPLEVYFFDSIAANIISAHEDSIVVIVPDGVSKGSITVVANGGLTRSPVPFFSTNTILVNDFDGNGLRAETNKWLFVGSVDQNANNAVQVNNPFALDGNFLRLTGRDEFGIGWIGGAENHSWDTDVFDNFGIRTSNNNTLLKMDVHSNGNQFTHLIIVLLERDGSFNDFTEKIEVDWDGWREISIPLNRFTDLNGASIDPAKVRTVKVHLNNVEGTNQILEVNIDNLRFVEIL